MTKQTERLEQEYIDQSLQNERTPNHTKDIGEIVLKTQIDVLRYDSEGTYIDGDW